MKRCATCLRQIPLLRIPYIITYTVIIIIIVVVAALAAAPIAQGAEITTDADGGLVFADGDDTVGLRSLLDRLRQAENTIVTLSGALQSVQTELSVLKSASVQQSYQLANVSNATQSVLVGLRSLVDYPITDVCFGEWAFVAGRGCHKAASAAGCATQVFTSTLPFTSVTGRLTAFQEGSPDAFNQLHAGPDGDAIVISSFDRHQNSFIWRRLFKSVLSSRVELPLVWRRGTGWKLLLRDRKLDLQSVRFSIFHKETFCVCPIVQSEPAIFPDWYQDQNMSQSRRYR